MRVALVGPRPPPTSPRSEPSGTSSSCQGPCRPRCTGPHRGHSRGMRSRGGGAGSRTGLRVAHGFTWSLSSRSTKQIPGATPRDKPPHPGRATVSCRCHPGTSRMLVGQPPCCVMAADMSVFQAALENPSGAERGNRVTPDTLPGRARRVSVLGPANASASGRRQPLQPRPDGAAVGTRSGPRPFSRRRATGVRGRRGTCDVGAGSGESVRRAHSPQRPQHSAFTSTGLASVSSSLPPRPSPQNPLCGPGPRGPCHAGRAPRVQRRRGDRRPAEARCQALPGSLCEPPALSVELRLSVCLPGSWG